MAEYFVASAGSDASDGMSGPWQTLSKVASSSFSAGDTIYLNRGDVWRESLVFPSSGSAGSVITIKPYGSGADPIICAADIATGWSKTGGLTITYEISRTLPANCTAMLWQDGVRLTSRANTALVDANPGSFYHDTTGNVLYVSASDSGNPESNGKTYEMPARTFCFKDNGKSYIRVEDVEFAKAYAVDATYGNVEISGKHNYFLRCTSRNTRRHAFQFLTGAYRTYADYCTATDVVASFAVSFFQHCVQCEFRYGTITDSAGYVTIHGSSGAATFMPMLCGAYRCTMSNSSRAADVTPVYFFEFYSNVSCFIRGCDIAGVTTNNAVYFKEGRVYSFKFIANICDTSLCHTDYDWLFLNATPGVQVLHNLFFGDNNRRTVRAYTGATGTVIVGNVFYATDEAIDVDAASQAGTLSDRNVFYTMGTRVGRWGGTTYANLGLWQAASSQDANSINSSPEFTDYAGGDYRPDTGSPLIGMGSFSGIGNDSLGNVYKSVPSAGPCEVDWTRPIAPSRLPTSRLSA